MNVLKFRTYRDWIKFKAMAKLGQYTVECISDEGTTKVEVLISSWFKQGKWKRVLLTDPPSAYYSFPGAKGKFPGGRGEVGRRVTPKPKTVTLTAQEYNRLLMDAKVNAYKRSAKG